MKGPTITVLIIAFGLLLAGKLVARQEQNPKYVSVAFVSGHDWITIEHIHWLLLAHHIESGAQGSRGYSISVPAKYQQEAIRLLKADAQQRHYMIAIPSANFNQRAPSEKDWKERRLNARYSQLLRQPDYRASTTFGRFLRCQEIKHLAVQYPYVLSIQYLPRSYLDTDGKEHVGYEVKINMAASLHKPDPSYHNYYQVWREGKQIQDAWGYGSE